MNDKMVDKNHEMTKQQFEIVRELCSVMPKSLRQYRYYTNMEKMADLQIHPESEERSEPGRIDIAPDAPSGSRNSIDSIAEPGQLDGENGLDGIHGEEQPIDGRVEEPMDGPSEQIDSRVSNKQKKDKELPSKIPKFEFIKFELPNQKKMNFQEIKDRMRNFGESEVVDDREDARFLVEQLDFISDRGNHIISKLRPKLDHIVENSNGVLKGYHLFDDGLDPYEGGSRRYPRRQLKYNPSPEDKAIFLGGVQVGYMISQIPWLNTRTWNGMGIALNNVPKTLEIQ